MNIAVITPILDFDSKNPEVKTIINLCNNLFHNGHFITFFTTTASSKQTYSSVFKSGKFIYKGMSIYRFNPKFQKHYRGFKKFTSWIFSGLYSRRDEANWLRQAGPVVPNLLSKAKELQDKFDLFLIYGQHSYLNFKIAKHIKKKKMLFVMNDDPKLLKFDMFRETLEMSDALVFFTEHQKNVYNQIFSSINSKPYSIISPIVDDEINEYDIPSFKIKNNIKKPFLLYLGEISEKEGSARIMKYFMYYKKMSFADLELVLMGKMSMPVIDHKSIKIIDNYSKKDKHSALKGAFLNILPSTSDIIGYEIINSFKAGKPIIADVRNENYKEYLKKTHAGLPYSDYFEFQEVLNLFFNGKNLNKKLSYKALEAYNQKYNKNIILNRLNNLMEKLI